MCPILYCGFRMPVYENLKKESVPEEMLELETWPLLAQLVLHGQGSIGSILPVLNAFYRRRV